MLRILDEYIHECLCLKTARYLTDVDVISEISALIEARGISEHICSDNGLEFIAIAVKNWIESWRVEVQSKSIPAVLGCKMHA